MIIPRIVRQGASHEDAFEDARGISVFDFAATNDDMVENMVVGWGVLGTSFLRESRRAGSKPHNYRVVDRRRTNSVPEH